MNDTETRDLLLLFRILEDKPVLLASLLRHFGCAGAVLDSASAHGLSEAGMSNRVIRLVRHRRTSHQTRDELQRKVETDVRWLQQENNHLLLLGDTGYPALLAEIADPPVVLFCHGDLDALATFKIAIVGSRNPTRMGVKHAEEFARQFATMGVAVTSGLALGIDAAGHRGALAVDGITLAILGTGCDVIYPARHQRLAKLIADRGLIISEFPPGTRVYPGNFPRRNRIVTGLSLGTLVVEAQEKSGSLISARLAMEQGREVFAIPGSIQSRQSRGCHQLIREGVMLTENVDQMLQELASLAEFQLEKRGNQPELSMSPARKSVLDCLGAEPVVIDQLCHVLGMEVPELLALLVELEIDGCIVTEAGGYCLA
jgi:DNA processing protein